MNIPQLVPFLLGMAAYNFLPSWLWIATAIPWLYFDLTVAEDVDQARLRRVTGLIAYILGVLVWKLQWAWFSIAISIYILVMDYITYPE